MQGGRRGGGKRKRPAQILIGCLFSPHSRLKNTAVRMSIEYNLFSDLFQYYHQCPIKNSENT